MSRPRFTRSEPKYGSGRKTVTKAGGLPARLVELMGMMGYGLSEQEIASAWKITPKTVQYHRASLFRIMNFQTSADMIKTSVAFGLSPL